ncbi:MAG: Flp family type IVb pilin [Alphaproteobacteria bacterium]|nr:Flp family type IVb pilin [Alphaproteobacteria bacterium]
MIVRLFKAVKADRKGVTALEYGLIAAAIAVAIIGAVQLVGTNATATFNAVAGAMGG